MSDLRVAVTLEQCWHEVPGGTATSALGTVDAMRRQGEVGLVGVAARHRRPPEEAFRPTIPVRQLPLPRTLLYETWHGLRRPTVDRVTGPVDAIYVTGMAMPPRSAPLVVTVHDLAFLHHPEHHSRHGRRFFGRALDIIRDEADLVACPSQATVDDCMAAGIEAERLRMIPWGVEPSAVTPADLERVRHRYDLPASFVLWVGTIEPRKNLAGLLDAVGRLGPRATELVLVGPDGWNEDLGALLARYLDDATSVRSLGFVPDEDLGPLYAAARVFCYPSLLEGFGLPVLEAMAAGTPVVTSSGTSTEELVGDGGFAVDPRDPDAIAAALTRLLADDAEHHARSEGATRSAARYTWAATAAGVTAALRDVQPTRGNA